MDDWWLDWRKLPPEEIARRIQLTIDCARAVREFQISQELK